MAFPRSLLNDGEQLVLDLRPHWWYLAQSTAALVGSVIVALILLKLVGWGEALAQIPSGAIVLAALVWFGWKYSVWASTNFVLTDNRIISRRGVLSKQGVEIPLERINTVFFHQGVFERMIGAGDLTIESAGERGSETFEDVRKPALVQREIYVQMEANQNNMYGRMAAAHGGVPGAAQPVQPTLTVAEQLEKLHALHVAGALSDAEYEAEKARLLRS